MAGKNGCLAHPQSKEQSSPTIGHHRKEVCLNREMGSASIGHAAIINIQEGRPEPALLQLGGERRDGLENVISLFGGRRFDSSGPERP